MKKRKTRTQPFQCLIFHQRVGNQVTSVVVNAARSHSEPAENAASLERVGKLHRVVERDAKVLPFKIYPAVSHAAEEKKRLSGYPVAGVFVSKDVTNSNL